MKALLFVLIVLIAVFVFVRAYETQHALSGEPEPGSRSTEVGALGLPSWNYTPGECTEQLCMPRA